MSSNLVNIGLVTGGVLLLLAGGKKAKEVIDLKNKVNVRVSDPFVKLNLQGLHMEVTPLVDNPTKESLEITVPTVYLYLNGSEATRTQNNPAAKIKIVPGYGQKLKETGKDGKEKDVRYKLFIPIGSLIRVLPKVLLKIPALVLELTGIYKEYAAKIKSLTGTGAKAKMPESDKVAENVASMTAEEVENYIIQLNGLGDTDAGQQAEQIRAARAKMFADVTAALSRGFQGALSLEYSYTYYVAGILYDSGKTKVF